MIETYFYDPENEPDFDTFQDAQDVLQFLMADDIARLYKRGSEEDRRRIEDILRFGRDMTVLPANY